MLRRVHMYYNMVLKGYLAEDLWRVIDLVIDITDMTMTGRTWFPISPHDPNMIPKECWTSVANLNPTFLCGDFSVYPNFVAYVSVPSPTVVIPKFWPGGHRHIYFTCSVMGRLGAYVQLSRECIWCYLNDRLSIDTYKYKLTQLKYPSYKWLKDSVRNHGPNLQLDHPT